MIRRLADTLLEVADGRRRSAPLEARWLNLFGFCIRPGFGAAKDPWRITEARKVYAAGLGFAELRSRTGSSGWSCGSGPRADSPPASSASSRSA